MWPQRLPRTFEELTNKEVMMFRFATGRTIALLVAVDAALFGGAGIVGNHKSGWRGPAGNILWIAGLAGVVAVVVVIAVVVARRVRRQVPA
jgi:hypothetical protein